MTRKSNQSVPLPTATRQTYHHGDLRRALLGAAVQLVSEQGVAPLSLREVARRAGVTHNAPYRHFADKAALLAAVAEEGFGALTAAMRSESELRGEAPVHRFMGLAVAYVRFAVDNAAYFRVMFGPEAADKVAYPAVQTAEAAAYALCVAAIAACQQAGTVRPGDARTQALAAWAIMHGLSGLHLDGLVASAGLGDLSTEALATCIARQLFAGLAA